MFSGKRDALFIGRGYMYSAVIQLYRDKVFISKEMESYTEETFPAVFEKISKTLRRRVRIVLADEFVYITRLTFPHGTEITRERVAQKAKEEIPEDLSSTKWDFQTLTFTKQGGVSDEVLVQVAVLERRFYEMLKSSLANKRLEIESVIPESYACAQFSVLGADPVILVQKNPGNILLIALCNGFVMLSDTIEGEIVTPSLIQQFIASVERTKDILVKKVIFSYFSEEDVLPQEELVASGYSVERGYYNPMVGTALQKKVRGRDDEVLNVKLT